MTQGYKIVRVPVQNPKAGVGALRNLWGGICPQRGGVLQEHGAPAIQIILNDLPTNNWARCVSNFIAGEGAPAAPDNYTVTLAPKSFYSALVRPRACQQRCHHQHSLDHVQGVAMPLTA